MFRTQLHSVWLALNLALFIATFAALALGAFWIISSSDNQRQLQASQVERIVNHAMELSKGNPKTLRSLLSALPLSPMFSSLEIHSKAGRILDIQYATPSSVWSETPSTKTQVPMERILDGRSGVVIRLFPAQGFLVYRLMEVLPATLIMVAFAFLMVNLTAWVFRKRFSFGHVDETRWSKALAPEKLGGGGSAVGGISPADVLDCLPNAILRCDRQGRITYLNASAHDLLKLQIDGMNPADILDIIAPWDRARCVELLTKTYPLRGQERLETQLVGTRRGILPVMISFMPAPEVGDELVLDIQDNSDIRVQQEMLRLCNLLLDSIPLGLAVLSSEGKGELLYANPAFRKLLNLGDAATGNVAWLDRIASLGSIRLTEQIRSAISRMSGESIELPFNSAEGQSCTLELQILPVNSGEPRLICAIRDCSEEVSYRQLNEQENWARRRILDEMPVGLCITDDQAKIKAVNAAFVKLTTREPQQLIGTELAEWIADISTTLGLLYQGEYAVKAGHQNRVARLNTLPLASPEGDKQFVYFFEDITAFKNQAQADGIELNRLQQTLDSIADGIIVTNGEGFIQYMNPYAQEMTGLAEHQFKGMGFGQVVHLVDEKKREHLVDPATRAMRIGKVVKFRQDVLLIKKNKQELAVEISATPVFDRNDTVMGSVIIMKDVAEQRSLSQQMQLRASRDPLTSLINRSALLSLLERLQYEVEERSRQHTLCYMDLDNFKVVNDSCGHAAGDELLRQVSHLMNECLRATDTLARIGGDEFCAVFCNTPAENGAIVAEKIREAVKRFRFTWDDKFFEIGISIGLFGLQPGLSVEETIGAADQACYHAKEGGRDRVYVGALADKSGQKPVLTPWSERLSEAMDHDYFRLFRLDAKALKSNQPDALIYHEVLLQLHEPNQQPLVASAFMSNAHRLNLAQSIERWAIGKLFSSIGTNAMKDSSPEVFAIQLSAATLADSSFVAFLSEQRKRHGVSPNNICFEIAEDDLVQNFSVVQHFMREGKKTGYGFCLSRFGAGVSSFAYLRNLPLDYLKIDSSLTHRLDSDPIDAVIVRAIQAIGQHMHIRIISQNLPDQSLRELMSSLGIDYMLEPVSELMPLESVAER